jgi:uncharacterized membrane protein
MAVAGQRSMGAAAALAKTAVGLGTAVAMERAVATTTGAKTMGTAATTKKRVLSNLPVTGKLQKRLFKQRGDHIRDRPFERTVRIKDQLR